MKIDVDMVQQELENENRELTVSMQSSYEIGPDILEFTSSKQLSGEAYKNLKDHMLYVTQSLVRAICCMIESKISGNTKYLSAVNQYLSGMGKLDLDQLMNSKNQIETQDNIIKSNPIVATTALPYSIAVNSAVKKIDEKIQKMQEFLAASQGCYDDFSEKYSLVMQGITAAKALAYDSSTSTCPNISNANMQWAQTVNQFYENKNREILHEKYGEYLKDNPGMETNMMIIAAYERFHEENAKIYDNLLEPLEEDDVINIKIKTYSADQLYRDMMFEYVDDAKIELTDEGGSYYSPSENKIVLCEQTFRKDGYQTFFHESGHAIDANYSKDNNLAQDISESFVGSNGTTLDQSTVNNVGEMYPESKAFIDEMLSKMGNS